MIQITAHMRILVATGAVDFRKGIDGLLMLCRKVFEADPFSGTVFVFTNKSRQSLKILVYDGQGFWLCHKRLSQGRFFWPEGNGHKRLLAQQLQMLLWNTNPFHVKIPEPWKQIPTFSAGP
jgi:transposase